MSDATDTARSVETGRPPDGGVPQHAPEAATVVRAVTAIMGTVVGLTFLFGFGNVLTLVRWYRSSQPPLAIAMSRIVADVGTRVAALGT
jgi:hypothetical protein